MREPRRRRSRAEAAQLVGEYEASGLSRVEFCRRHELALTTLTRHRRRRQQERGEAAGPRRWVAVELSGSHHWAASEAEGALWARLAVVLSSGRRIEVGREFDAKTLEQLLHLLEPV